MLEGILGPQLEGKLDMNVMQSNMVHTNKQCNNRKITHSAKKH